MIRPSGIASWKWNYRFEEKQKTLTLGSYPFITLREARQKYFEARRIQENNQDPCAEKQEIKLKRKMAIANTLEHIAREWHRRQLPRWKPDHITNRRLYKTACASYFLRCAVLKMLMHYVYIPLFVLRWP